MTQKEKMNLFYVISGVFFLQFPEIFFLGLEKCFPLLFWAFLLYFALTYREDTKRHALSIFHLVMGESISENKKEPTAGWQERMTEFWKDSESPTRENLQKFCQFSRSEAEKVLKFLKDRKALIRGGENNQYIKQISDLSPLFEEMEIIRA